MQRARGTAVILQLGPEALTFPSLPRHRQTRRAGSPHGPQRTGDERNTCPGREKYPGLAEVASARVVTARSDAEMPVVVPTTQSTVTVKAVRNGSRFAGTISGRSSASARSGRSGTHTTPVQWRSIKATDAAVASLAAPMKSPSFSRSKSSCEEWWAVLSSASKGVPQRGLTTTRANEPLLIASSARGTGATTAISVLHPVAQIPKTLCSSAKNVSEDWGGELLTPEKHQSITSLYQFPSYPSPPAPLVSGFRAAFLVNVR